MVRDQYQQQTNLLPMALLVESTSTADLQTRLQWSTTMFDTTAATIDRTEVLQAKLDAAKKKQAAIEKQIAADRKTRSGEPGHQAAAGGAGRAAAGVGGLAAVAAAGRPRPQAATEVAQDKRAYASLTQERAEVEQRIAARIAKAKAEAARKAAAERGRQERGRQGRDGRRAAAKRAAGQAKERAEAAGRRAGG